MSGVVVLATRVPTGPVAGLYAGGGADLLAAGALPTGTLRASQARILLTALLACYRDPVRVAEELVRRVDHAGTPVPVSPLERKH